MIVVLSPAKSLDFENPSVTEQTSEGVFGKDAALLAKGLKQLEVEKIGQLMQISDNLAALNYRRFQSWSMPKDLADKNTKQAALAFKGEVYQGLDASSLEEADFDFAQKHIRILSGLYGVLRPLDLIKPYRLEMKTKLENERGKNLYEFWGTSITEQLNRIAKATDSNVLINLASNEYFKVVKKKHLNPPILTPVFKDFKNGKYKVISFFAKKARGQMARFIIQNRIVHPLELKQFNVGGYTYSEEMTIGSEMVFIRG